MCYYTNGSKSDTRDILTAGNLWCDILYHLPIFLLLEISTYMKHDMDNRPMIRLHSTKNMEKFSSAEDNIDWSNIYHCNSPNEAYNYFHAKVTVILNVFQR